MRYADVVNFDPIDSVIQLTDANDKNIAANLVRTYVMSDDMAERIKHSMLSQLRLDDAVDNKGVLLIGNYGTGKSHLMSIISSIALDSGYIQLLNNKKFAEDVRCIAGRFEVLRIEIGATQMSLRNIIFNKVKQDFASRGLTFKFKDEKDIITNKDELTQMMQVFSSNYKDKGYLIIIDELLDYLRGRNTFDVVRDLGFLRELGEYPKTSHFRVVFGMQEKLFDNPNFSFVSETLNRVKDRYEQTIIQKEDTAYVVSQRILKKTLEQKSVIREHLLPYCTFYSNMSERLEEYVELFPIHPAYIDVFNKIYIIENRHILKNISEMISKILNEDISQNAPGVLSYDSYWSFIKGDGLLLSDTNIKKVVEQSRVLEEVIRHSFSKPLYKSLALQIVNALSVHRLTTGDISVRIGLTAENLKDDLCLYIQNLPDNSSDTLLSLVSQVLIDIRTTTNGQFIKNNEDSGQYYLDPNDTGIDYDMKIAQRAAVMDDDSMNNYFYKVVYYCLDWEQKEYVDTFNIYEHTLNWASHNIFRRGYLFLGTPESRPTAQPPEDYYIYFVPPYGDRSYSNENKQDEVFFIFKQNEEFRNNLRLYSAALIWKDLAEESNKNAYQSKADAFRRKLTGFLSDNKNTCFETVYKGQKKQLMEVMGSQYKANNPFKETIDLVASLCLDDWFKKLYPDMPTFKTPLTQRNFAETVRAGIDRFAGRTNQQANALLESFGLLEGETIKVSNSKYAQYYIGLFNHLPANNVLNSSDIFFEGYRGESFDKHFKISYALMSIVMLSLVYTGNAVITLRNGTQLTASELESLPRTNVFDVYDFKHISKPQDIHLAELVRLYELLDLPTGLIKNPAQREVGLPQMLVKVQEKVSSAVKAHSKVTSDFNLWGESLIAEHIAENYRSAAASVRDTLGNFHTRFNTVPKLNNYSYTMEQIEQLGKNISAADIVLEYEVFRDDCTTHIQYLMNLEGMELPSSLKNAIIDAKGNFRAIRDSLADGKSGKSAALDVTGMISRVRDDYVSHYFAEHNKRRLNSNGSKRKGDLMNSGKLLNLKKLRSLSILSGSKLEDIEKDLAGLKVCVGLAPLTLKTSPLCPICHYLPGAGDLPVTGRLDEIEDKADKLLAEWTVTLLNTISDPLVMEQKGFLTSSQQKALDAFIQSKTLPEAVDTFFADAIKALLQGFEPVTISAEELFGKLDALGPCDTETFKKQVLAAIDSYVWGMDKVKTRIIIKK